MALRGACEGGQGRRKGQGGVSGPSVITAAAGGEREGGGGGGGSDVDDDEDDDVGEREKRKRGMGERRRNLERKGGIK